MAAGKETTFGSRTFAHHVGASVLGITFTASNPVSSLAVFSATKLVNVDEGSGTTRLSSAELLHAVTAIPTSAKPSASGPLVPAFGLLAIVEGERVSR